LDDADAIAQCLGDLEGVRRHHDGVPAARVLAKQILERARRFRVQADHRLVDDDDLRLVHERARDDELLPHAMAVTLDELIAPLLEIEQRQQLSPSALDVGAALPVQPRDEAQELDAGELLVDERAVGDEAELLLRGHRIISEIDAGDAHRA
jgi:hypothetical protein